MIRKLAALTVLTLAILGVSTVLTGGSASAEAMPETTAVETTSERNPYAYTAQSGDSYTVLARKAVQTYGIRENVNLTQAEIIAAETFLTSDAGYPELNLGQAVSFNKDAVKAAMDKAKALTDHQKALWQTYVKYVDFDTRDNGEA